MELLRPRIHAIAPEVRLNFGQNVLTPLIDKTQSDRILEVVVRIVDIMMRTSEEDETMRMRFFKLFNARIAKKIYERLYHILALEDWAQFQHHFFIKHCINLLLWSVIEENKEKKSNEVIQTVLLNCATFWRTYETVFDLETLRRNHPGANDNDDQVLWDQDMDETKRSISSEISGDQLKMTIGITDQTSAKDLQIALIAGQQVQLFEMAAKFCVTDILPSFIELVHNSMFIVFHLI
ncbi:unnamed protein product [Gongylonema pulchrum]|uniref:Uncharacterized protein n=1 Tax=Gongylonema pulchrum TaxID=637853 RepID=A0A3P7QPB8_9BILA|nr:unnamed protein product [Gongylonema pulchrum]